MPENLVSRDGFASPVPRQPAHLHTQAESGAYLRGPSRVPRRRPLLICDRHTPSSQSRVYRVTQLRTDGVHCRESAGTGPVNLKVVPVTGAAILQVIMDQSMCASLFPHPLLVWSGHVESTWRCFEIFPRVWNAQSRCQNRNPALALARIELTSPQIKVKIDSRQQRERERERKKERELYGGWSYGDKLFYGREWARCQTLVVVCDRNKVVGPIPHDLAPLEIKEKPTTEIQ